MENYSLSDLAAVTKDADGMAGMAAQATVAADSIYTLHAETTIYIPVCCNGIPTISVDIGGVAGAISHVCASAVKLA